MIPETHKTKSDKQSSANEGLHVKEVKGRKRQETRPLMRDNIA